MKVELILVENLEAVVGVDQYVNVEVYEGEDAVGEAGGGVDVAVEPEQASVGRLETEDAVPAVCPEEFGAVCPSLDGADERMPHLLFEDGVEHDERAFAARDACGPATVNASVVLAGVYEYFLQTLLASSAP